MHHPDLRHRASVAISAAKVMKLDMHEAELRAAPGEPGVIEARKPRRAAGPAKHAFACESRRSPALRRAPLVEAPSRTTTAAMRRDRTSP